MTVLRCIAIDDEPLALDLIKVFISSRIDLKLLATFEDAVAALDFIRHNDIELVFLDINMPDITGIDLASKLDASISVIFTTAYKNFAYEGFELSAVDYLLKPISKDRFDRAVDKAVLHRKTLSDQGKTESDNDDFIFIWSEYQQVKVPLDTIEYIESREDYVCIYRKDKTFLMSLMTMKKMQEMLPADRFVRIHRSYIVPISGIHKYISKKIVLNSGKELPIGLSYQEDLKFKLGLG